MSYRNSNRYPSNGGRNDGNQQNWRSSNNQRDTNDDDGWGSARPNYQQRQPRNSNQNSNEGSGDNDGWGSAPNDGWGSAPNDGWGSAPARKPAQPRRQPDENDVNSSIQVPSNKVGKIIGRGGSKIRELQSETNTEVQIDKNATDAEYNMTKINLIGSDEDVQRVKKLIEDLVAEDNYSQSNGGGGRNKSWQQNPEPDSTPAPAPVEEEIIDWAAFNRQSEDFTKEFWAKLPDIIKNFYQEDPEVANFTPEQVAEIRALNNNISVGYVFENSQKVHIYNPVTSFEQCFREYPEIMEAIQNQGFAKPSPIQAQAWPILLSGQDMIGIAQTGTGKTLAFLLPAFIHIEGQTIPRSERTGPTVLVLAPTRELALQIEREVKKYSYKQMKVVCLYGGGSRRDQMDICAQGVDIVIATPGRLSDLSCAGSIDLKSVSYLVLDEADRMLDLGFEPQIRKILIDIRPNRQTVMTSATWPPGVRRLAESYSQDPIQVCVGTLDLAAVHSVSQSIVILEDNDDVKYEELMAILTNLEPDDKVIVFCGKKSRVDHVASELCLQQVNCQTIHGDLEQSDREQALADLASGAVQILIATDVASRGIDICDVTHVVNYDFPRNVEEYVHRVGRTGRAGKTGQSITFITRGDWRNAKELISILEEANQPVPQELHEMSQRFEKFKERKDNEREALRNYGRGGGGRGGGGYGGGGRGGGGYGGGRGGGGRRW